MSSGFGSGAEVYCVDGVKRFCLGNKMCPWRNIGSPSCAAGFARSDCSLAGGVNKEQSMIDASGHYRTCRRHCRGRWWWRRCS